MGIETKNKEIDGHKYTVTSFGGLEGVRIKAILMKYLGPSLLSVAAIGATSGKKFSETDIDSTVISKLFEGLFTSINENEYTSFILRLLKCTRRDNIEITEDIFNMEFAGEYASLYKVIFFVLEVNYKKSFFGESGIGSLIKEIQGLMPQEMK